MRPAEKNPLAYGGRRSNMEAMKALQASDPEIFKAIQGELLRQQDGLEMIASENYASLAVMEAQGSVLHQ